MRRVLLEAMDTEPLKHMERQAQKEADKLQAQAARMQRSADKMRKELKRRAG